MASTEDKTPEAPRPPFPIESVAWEDWAHGDRFGGRVRRLGQFAGATQIGVNYEELPPGKQSCPSHYHFREEEHLWLLAGAATLRLGDATHMMSAGDYICFPAGQRAGHCLINQSDSVCRFLVIGGRDPQEVVVYPDSGKVLVGATDELYDIKATRDYWEGE
jgi:uncharacterized cupin superfamily protein